MKSHFCIKLLAVAAIVVLWNPVCYSILSSLEWIDSSLDTLQDSMNQLVVKKIPNAACDKLSQTRGSGCHPSDATLLGQWFFSMKCIILCNKGFGMPLKYMHDVEVNCQFSENNTLNMTMGEIEWSAECHCPQGSISSGSNFSIEVVSYSLMADEYSKLKCDDPGASVHTVSTMTIYNFASCREAPSICDRHATCVGDVCICAQGYTGNGFDCFYQCKVPSSERTLAIENSKGISLSEGDLIVELDNITVTCDQLDRKIFYLTCGCDGFADLRPCEKAVYLIGGEVRDGWTDSITVFYPETPLKSYVSRTKLTTTRAYHESYLTKNGSLIVINGRGFLNAIEVFNPATKKWGVASDSSEYIYGQLLNEIDDQLYFCGDCGVGNDNCFVFSLETALIKNSYQMQKRRCSPCSFVIDNNLYAVGGDMYVTDGFNVEMLNLTAASPAWENRKAYPAGVIIGCAAAVHDGLGYVCGGMFYDNGYDELDDCYVYDPDFDTWMEIESMNEKRGRFSMIQLDGVLYSIHGFSHTDVNSELSSTVEYYNITGDRKWTLIPGIGELLEASAAYSIAYSWN